MTGEFEREDAEAERLVRISFFWQWLGLGLLIAGQVLRFVLPDEYIPAECVLVLIAVGITFYSISKVTDADAAAYPRQHRDVQQKRFRVSLVAMLMLGSFGAGELARLPVPPALDLVMLWYGLTMLLVPAFCFTYGVKRDLDEEINRILRTKALRLGYVTLLLVLVAVAVVAAIRPAALMIALAWGLFAGIAVPILAYVVLDWLSDRGETP
jgi:hypothetical protein